MASLRPADLQLWNALLAYLSYLAKFLGPAGLAVFCVHPRTSVHLAKLAIVLEDRPGTTMPFDTAKTPCASSPTGRARTTSWGPPWPGRVWATRRSAIAQSRCGSSRRWRGTPRSIDPSMDRCGWSRGYSAQARGIEVRRTSWVRSKGIGPRLRTGALRRCRRPGPGSMGRRLRVLYTLSDS